MANAVNLVVPSPTQEFRLSSLEYERRARKLRQKPAYFDSRPATAPT